MKISYIGKIFCFNLVLSFLFLYNTHSLNAEPIEGWSKNFGVDDSQYYNNPNGIATDKLGNVIVTGGSGAFYAENYKTVKYNTDGEELWIKTYDGGRSDLFDVTEGVAVAVDNEGKVIVTGSPGNGATNDYYTIKYDQDGEVLWTQAFDGGGEDIATGVATDDIGNIVVTGYSNNSATDDYHTIKYDQNGEVLWTQTFDSGETDQASSVAIDKEGNVIVTGMSADDLYTIKYDKNGNELWERLFDGGNTEGATEVAVDRQGNIVVTGFSNERDGLMVKYDKNGAMLWNKLFSDFTIYGVDIDRVGNIVATGKEGEEGSFRHDAMIKKYDANGNILWSKIFATGSFWLGEVVAKQVAIDRSGNILVTGAVSGVIGQRSATKKYVENVLINNIWTSDFFDNPREIFEPGEFFRVHVDFAISGSPSTTYNISAIGGAQEETGRIWRLGEQTMAGIAPGAYSLTWDKKIPSTVKSGSKAKLGIKISAEALDTTPYKLVPAIEKREFIIK